MSETKQLTIVDTISKMEPEFKKALPAHIPSDRFVRNALTAINGNPDLLKDDVDRRSLQAAVMQAAQDGLVIDKREAALVIFNGKDGVKTVQYIAMVAGLIKKMRNSGDISNISYGLVYQNEFDTGRFKYIKGDTESLTHDPILFGEKGAMIGVYAVVTLKDGAKVREFMDMKQIEKVRAASRGGKSQYGPWTQWFEEMAVKSVLRKVYKLCPSSSDLDNVFRDEDEFGPIEAPVQHEATKQTEEPKGTRASAAMKAMAKEADVIEGELVNVEPPM